MTNIEGLIQTWLQRLQAITVNANELSDAESTQRIRIRVREGSYQGITQQRAQAAMEQLTNLVDDYLLLARIVDQAVQVNNVGLFGSRDSADERILALLQGPSIERSKLHVPLAQRALLGSAQQQSRLTPEQLLECMQREFVQARDTFAAIDHAQTQGEAAFDALSQDFARVQERAMRLQPEADQPPLIALQDLQADPLNAEIGMASMRRGIKAWSESLDVVEQSATRAREAVAQAHASLRALQRLDAELKGLRADLQPLLGAQLAASHASSSASRLDLLCSWCDTLDTSLSAGHWAAVVVGASRLHAALAEARGDVQRVLEQLRSQRDAMDELSGQFTALQAKEHAVRGHGPVDPALQSLREQIAAALQQRPLQSEAIGTLLKHYRALLGGSPRN